MSGTVFSDFVRILASHTAIHEIGQRDESQIGISSSADTLSGEFLGSTRPAGDIAPAKVETML